jgi:hypothetical protein
MTGQFLIEPDWDAEKTAFEADAKSKGMRLDKIIGGFYVDQGTQHAWSAWVKSAAISCNFGEGSK